MDTEIDEILDSFERKEKEFAATVRPGDVVYANGDKRFTFSEFRYCTEGKGYVVQDIKRDNCVCDSDIKGETLYLCSLSITHVERDGKVVWDNRTTVVFRYQRGLDCHADRYGFPIELDGVYQGHWLKHYSPDECDDEAQDVILVELITPFRDGQEGDLIVVNLNDMEILETK